MLRILMIDGERLFFEGFRALLSSRDPEIEVIGNATDGDDVQERLIGETPDVITLDLRLNGTNGLGVLADVTRVAPEARVLILTMCSSRDHVCAAFHAGASGYALKDQPSAEVCEAIRTVAAGRRYLAPRLPRELMDGGNGHTALEKLSPREREIFELVVRGMSTQRIAEELTISVKTVETHRAHINRKIGAHSAADLIRYAVEHQLLV
jgi:DNA-binding NarL/FixJ family response regulator